MKKPFNTAKWHYFVLTPEAQFRQDDDGKIRENLGTVSFRTYTDRVGALSGGAKTGAAVQYVISKDERGRDKGKNFTLSQSHNAFMVNDTDTDIYGVRMFDFLANAPECEGSPNGVYTTDSNGDRVQLNVRYRLMNTEADAEVALEATVNRANAQVSASSLDEQTLAEVAAIGIGYHGRPDKLMRHRVVEWAGKRPYDFFEVLESGDRLYKAIIRKAAAENILQIRGELHYWNNLLIGSSENAAIQHLIEHPDVLDALKERVNLNIQERPAPPAKGGKKKA